MRYFLLAIVMFFGGIAGGVLANDVVSKAQDNAKSKEMKEKVRVYEEELRAEQEKLADKMAAEAELKETKKYEYEDEITEALKTRWNTGEWVEKHLESQNRLLQLATPGKLSNTYTVRYGSSRQGPSGTFQIISTKDLGTLMLDTRSGQTWALAKKDGKLNWTKVDLPEELKAPEKPEVRVTPRVIPDVTVPRTTPTGNAYLGVSVEETDDGLKITQVNKGTPAATFGLKAGDIVTSADGKTMNTLDDFTGAIKSKNGGDSMTLSITRSVTAGRDNVVEITFDVEVILAGRPGSRNSRSTPRKR